MTTPESDRTSSGTLAKEIRARADSQQAVATTLATSERIIARVTDGIYREPWAAFRELIVNAYDADASYVVIETSQPDFNRITVRDDGIGMSPDVLAYIIQNIGGSAKRTPVGATLNTTQSDAPDLSPSGRPLIGKIGIGLFAVAQLTQHFQIITKAAGENYRLSATVTLRTHDEGPMQHSETEYVAGDVTILSQKDEVSSHGTSVVLYQLRDEVRRTLKSTRLWDATLLSTDADDTVQKAPQFHIGYSSPACSQKPNLPWEPSDRPREKFERLFAAIGMHSGRGPKAANLDHLDEYLRLIWKLSLSLPLDYIAGHPFDLDGSDAVQVFTMPNKGQAKILTLNDTETIRKHFGLRAGHERGQDQFSVTLDGIALHRPIRLPCKIAKLSSRIKTPVILAAKQDNPFPSSEHLDRAGGPLSFEAYLYWNNQIIPKETAGVLVRIRDASGTLFDPTFLNYQVSEQNRLRQITAEIFVHEGLDSAINIDRESFNYSHPHFLFIQKWLHRALRLLANRLKALAAADLAQAKAKLRDEALRYAEEVWNRRLGKDADPPFAEIPAGHLPTEVGSVALEWASPDLLTAKKKPVGVKRVAALAAILEAYGVLSELSLEERGQLIADIVSLPETRP